LAGLWLPAHRHIRGVPAELTFRGAVICRWDYTTHYDDPPTFVTHYCCSVEHPDGPGVVVRCGPVASVDVLQEVRSSAQGRFKVGDIVDVHCSPRRRMIHQITLVEAAPR
jgi:hypothetical protein